MKINENFYKEMLDNLYDAVYFVDCDGHITYWNKAAEELTGFKAEEVVGLRCSDSVLNHVDEKGNRLCKGLCPLHKTIKDGKKRTEQIYLNHKQGHRVPVFTKIVPIKDEYDSTIGAVEIFCDNSKRIEEDKKLKELAKLAFLDTLTGVTNRRYIDMKIESKLLEIKNEAPDFGVLIVDIDGFDNINKVYGRKAGDEVLKIVANTIRFNISNTDIVARLEGFKFLVLCTNTKKSLMILFADKLRNLISASTVKHEEESILVTVSIGGTIAKRNDTREILIKRSIEQLEMSNAAGPSTVYIDRE